MPKRVVLDTNVLISAIAFGGIPLQILQSGLRGKFVLCLSEAICNELVGVLQGPKFHYPKEVTDAITSNLFEQAIITNPPHQVSVIKNDPTDNRILEAALSVHAELIVSGDRHLLEIGEFRGIRILPPKKFVQEFMED